MEENYIKENYKETNNIEKKFQFKPLNSKRKINHNSFDKFINKDYNNNSNIYSLKDSISINKSIKNELINENIDGNNSKLNSIIKSDLNLDNFETFSNINTLKNSMENKNELSIDYSKFDKNQNSLIQNSVKNYKKGLEQFLNINNDLKEIGSRSSLTSAISMEFNPKQLFDKSEISEIDNNKFKKDSNNISINEKFIDNMLVNRNKYINRNNYNNNINHIIYNNVENNFYKKINISDKNKNTSSKIRENNLKKKSYLLIKKQQIQKNVKKFINKDNGDKKINKIINDKKVNNKKECKYSQLGNENIISSRNIRKSKNLTLTPTNDLQFNNKHFSLTSRNSNQIFSHKYRGNDNKENILTEITKLKEKIREQNMKELNYKIEIERLKKNNQNKNDNSYYFNHNFDNISFNPKSDYFLLNYKEKDLINKNNNNYINKEFNSKNKMIFYQSFKQLFKEFNINENIIFDNIENKNIIDDSDKINYDEIFKKYPQLKMFIQIIINKYKKEKNSRIILEEKTLQLLTNDMKTIDTLEKKIKKMNKNTNHKRVKSEVNSTENNLTTNSIGSCDI